MKGVVFTEFMEMVDTRMGEAMLDDIITRAELPNDGAYTAVGTYDHAELVHLVVALSEVTGSPVPALIHLFGEHLFSRFAISYQSMFQGADHAFDFLERVDRVIHVEVRKLYPDAELPTLHCERPAPGQLTLLYSSPRGFGDLAEGLIQGCIKHFDAPIAVRRENLDKEGDQHRVRFHLQQEAR